MFDEVFETKSEENYNYKSVKVGAYLNGIFALIMFIPYIIEFFFKLRGKLLKESFAKVNQDGSLNRPYEKYYGIEHVAIDIIKKIKGKYYEKEVVILLLLFQLICCLISLSLFLFLIK